MRRCLGLILAMVATTCLCRPAVEAPGAAGNPQQQLLASLVRRGWPKSVSQEQNHLNSRFLPHIFTELGDRKDYVYGAEGLEALHEHYYPDWMDFGRRSADDSVDAA